MTLNRVMAAILIYFTEFRTFGADYGTVVEVRSTPQHKMWLKESNFQGCMICGDIFRDN